MNLEIFIFPSHLITGTRCYKLSCFFKGKHNLWWILQLENFYLEKILTLGKQWNKERFAKGPGRVQTRRNNRDSLSWSKRNWQFFFPFHCSVQLRFEESLKRFAIRSTIYALNIILTVGYCDVNFGAALPFYLSLRLHGRYGKTWNISIRHPKCSSLRFLFAFRSVLE